MAHRVLYLAASAAPLAAAFVAAPAMAQDQTQGVWNGFYVGANLGAAWGDNNLQGRVSPGRGPIVIAPGDAALINSQGSSGNNKTGFTGGVEGGYNYQSGNWLFGLETDFGVQDINERSDHTFVSTGGLITPTPTFRVTQRAKTDWIWTVRPRVGYATGPWLFYGTGGMAMSDIKVTLNYSDTLPTPHTANTEKSSTRAGWTAGAGAAYAWSPQWSVKGEWLYADFGSISTTASSPSGFVNLTSEAKIKSNLFRVGVDYKF